MASLTHCHDYNAWNAFYLPNTKYIKAAQALMKPIQAQHIDIPSLMVDTTTH